MVLCVDDQRQLAAQDKRSLARARLMHRRVGRTAGRSAGRERVAGDVGALARKGRRELLGAVAAALACAPRTARNDNHVLCLVEAKELGER